MRTIWTTLLLIVLAAPVFAAEKRPAYCPVPNEFKKSNFEGLWTGEWLPARHRFCFLLVSTKNNEAEAIYSWDDLGSKTRAGWRKIRTSRISGPEMIFDWTCPEGHPIELRINFQENQADFLHGEFTPLRSPIKKFE